MEVEDDCDNHIDDQQIKQINIQRDKLEQQFRENGWQIYSRKPPQINYNQSLRFMQTECDYYTCYDLENKTSKSVIRMFGINSDGNSFVVHIRGFLSYFYMPFPEQLVDQPQAIEGFRLQFNELLAQQRQFKGAKPIEKIEKCVKESIRNYKGDNGKSTFLKVYVQLPSYVAMIRNFLKSEQRQVMRIDLPGLTFESNVPYALRFMVDKDIVGMGWVEIQDFWERQNKMTFCQIEIEVDERNVNAISIDDESSIAPLRILSFDIECAAEKGFPQEQYHPVIQIACIVKEHDKQDEIVRTVFTFGTCDEIPGARVMHFQKEEEVLTQFELFMKALDPDIVIGYNIQNFDLPYIIKRAGVLKIPNFGQFSRIIGTQSKIKDGKFLSKAMGMRDTKEVNMEGRIQIDMMMHMMREHKLSSYSLNNVSQFYQFYLDSNFLRLKKKMSIIQLFINCNTVLIFIIILNLASSETRKRIAVYCLKDAWLPILLIDKLFCIYNYSEMARVTGVPINYLFMRGQQIKVASQLMRKSKEFGYLMPTESFKGGETTQYEGAFVIDPEKSYYEHPIATLDFASLYPSIMMAYNMCYCTLLTGRHNLTQEDLFQVPDSQIQFVKPSKRKGILPLILEDLINARKRAREQLKKETDPFKKAVLDGRQLALKISANSVYGFTGAQVGQLPCLEISSSITSYGREMIKLTKQKVLEQYTIQNGYPENAQVIYGDTDSVMVYFGVKTVADAMQLGLEAASMITKCFPPPIKLEFEKVYYPYLLINRKRYAGLLWTKPDKWDKIDTKGIESVRRDNCFLIRKMITQILDYLLIEKNKQKAVEYVKEQIGLLFQNKIDISELVITKSLNMKNQDKRKNKGEKGDQAEGGKLIQSYKQKQAHVVLAEKMQQKDDNSAPAAGDRIAYIIIQGVKGQKPSDLAEDPVDVLTQNKPIDFDYYLNNQIKKPLLRIFEFVISNPESMFKGEHTKIRIQAAINTNQGMGKFVKKQNQCLGCKCQLKEEEALCLMCKKNKGLEIFMKHSMEFQELEQQFHNYWSTCQNCQGSSFIEVICSNRDCEIYYKRIKVREELQNKAPQYQKLNDLTW